MKEYQQILSLKLSDENGTLPTFTKVMQTLSCIQTIKVVTKKKFSKPTYKNKCD